MLASDQAHGTGSMGRAALAGWTSLLLLHCYIILALIAIGVVAWFAIGFYQWFMHPDVTFLIGSLYWILAGAWAAIVAAAGVLMVVITTLIVAIVPLGLTVLLFATTQSACPHIGRDISWPFVGVASVLIFSTWMAIPTLLLTLAIIGFLGAVLPVLRDPVSWPIVPIALAASFHTLPEPRYILVVLWACVLGAIAAYYAGRNFFGSAQISVRNSASTAS